MRNLDRALADITSIRRRYGSCRAYWLDPPDSSVVLAMAQAIGAALNNAQKRLHLQDIRREHLIDQVCVQEILPPEGH